jgi:hypothetical protein
MDSASNQRNSLSAWHVSCDVRPLLSLPLRACFRVCIQTAGNNCHNLCAEEYDYVHALFWERRHWYFETFNTLRRLYREPLVQRLDTLNDLMLKLHVIFEDSRRWLKSAIFWDVPPCGSCKNRHFGETYCLHHQGKKSDRASNNVASNEQLKQANTANNVARSLTVFFLKMEAMRSSETRFPELHGATSQKTTFFAKASSCGSQERCYSSATRPAGQCCLRKPLLYLWRTVPDT